MKRLFDVVVASCALVILLPLLLSLALAVLVSSPGPIVYRGTRVGRAGRQFSILKFRSMRIAEQQGRDITVRDDPRVTAVGRFLRVSKFDELPQLWNVVCGQMSLVGPRPEAPRYVETYTPEQREVLSVRPGMTGLTQIYFRHEELLLRGSQVERYYETVVMPAKLEIDAYYARHHTFWLDLKVLALTFVALFRPVRPPNTPPFTVTVLSGKTPQESYPVS
jgi:lipopolysaccharide/colanic/teichoic acid biosynthesis glycosyltransferase